jgi:hypothetical protein
MALQGVQRFQESEGWAVQCVRCGRAIKSPAATVQTRGRPMALGPKCARLMGLLNPQHRQPTPTTGQQPQDDQLRLWDVEP